MNINKVNLVYFSATFSTQKILRSIVKGLVIEDVEEFDITHSISEGKTLNKDELLVVGVPVYSGRIPQSAVDSINKFFGNCSPAIIVCVYGNRDYDDALLELKEIVECNTFKIISAATFIAKHSIFHHIATNRPDDDDSNLAFEFGQKSINIIKNIDDIYIVPEISIKGNKPYRKASKIPLKPRVNSNCNKCSKCAEQCPVGAIDKDNPKKIDKEKCISCGRCIELCSNKARSFGGLLYNIAKKRFSKKHSERKKVEFFFAYDND